MKTQVSIVVHKMNNENTSGLLYFWDPQIKNHYENVAIFKNLKEEFLFWYFQLTLTKFHSFIDTLMAN
jgi:hypothetical protein